MTERIGLVVGMEDTFPPAFIAKVNETPGFLAEIVKFGGTRAHDEPLTHRVIVDRMSHEVPFYRFHLKAAALAGSYVINDPFWWSADDKFFGFSLATKLGVAVPRTVLLPSKAYIPGVDPRRSLRNLQYPLDWEGIGKYVGFPAILKPADGGGWKNVSRVDSLEDLFRQYDASGQLVMTLQEFIDFDEYVRCICIGREFILPIKYDPRRRCYVEADNFLPKSVEAKVLDGAWALNQALGYDMNSVEFAIRDGVPYAIDFTNPAPDLCVRSLMPRYFHTCVDQMAKFVVKAAREGRRNEPSYAFRRFLDAPKPRPAGELGPGGWAPGGAAGAAAEARP